MTIMPNTQKSEYRLAAVKPKLPISRFKIMGFLYNKLESIKPKLQIDITVERKN